MEQTLIEDLVIESIKIYGIDAWYIPRTLVAKDDILNEDDLSTFNDAYMAEMYIKSVDGFEGEGDFLSKFGLQIRDSVTLTIARRTYESEVGTLEANRRPLEGDLIYLPLNNKVFEIQHVEHESIFYQMGSLQTYDLRAELFEYSGERFSTGYDFIDHNFADVDLFVPSEAVTYTVTYDNGFLLKDASSSDVPTKNLFLELEIGRTYVFNQSDSSNVGKRLNIYTTSTYNVEEANVLVNNLTTSGVLGSNALTTFTPISASNTSGNYFYRTDDGTTFGKVSLVESRIDNVELYDELADNTTIETLADNIIDFSESNPFGDI